ncbi:MAG: alanine--tRNA ligase [Candidatus Neomarinimicrobiota bacterium]|tara:strand:+ start:2498 stop:5083 length:2586 start_codon:yes stop_codon:yes gene_type:complete
MKSSEIRKSFIEFFQKKDHKFIRSAPVVPIGDPTLLFTNAGMNQFKPIFLDESKPEHVRAVNSQKCIRVSGKHNDLEEVGIDTFHHTFFEMLGNWSFGDYYKKDAIKWAWELLTDVWGLDKKRLWVTVYKEDQEAYDFWLSQTDIEEDRVLWFGKKENFWEMGETGPCGPCSEIHYYIGENTANQSSEGVNIDDQYWELWNLVFIQNERLADGSLVQLSQSHVDTGAGLERITSVLQNKTSNYETDLFQPVIKELESKSKIKYVDNPVPFQVIADHIRMLCFSIADGALPSNEGRGYVLRRILRRASRFGRVLKLEEPFLHKLVPTLCELMSEAYPELTEKSTHIKLVIGTEETLFNQTLGRGINHLEKLIDKLDSGSTISGEDAFKLYDTYGFPIDLTQLIARENDIKVDEDGFDSEMSKQKKKARQSGKFKLKDKNINWVTISSEKDSEFVGYEYLKTSSRVLKYAEIENGYIIVLDKTPFYAESGGQVGDRGSISFDGVDLTVIDVQKQNEMIVHLCKGEVSNWSKANSVKCSVDEDHRNNVKRNHTATHLLHAALKSVLGDQVQQAGSLVHPNYLRFDLTYFEKISKAQIREIEKIVNSQILINSTLNVSIKAYDEAIKNGVVALFGEKYGDQVRVVSTGKFSNELCGGTHVNSTGDIGLLKIIEESSLASGVRRIVAVTGSAALELFQNQSDLIFDIQRKFNCNEDELSNRINILYEDKKSLEKKLKQLNQSDDSEILLWIKDSIEVGDHVLVMRNLSIEDSDELKRLGDRLIAKIESGIGVLFNDGNDKPSAVIVVSDNLVKEKINAGALAKQIGSFMGGGGGGKPHLATAGGRDSSAIKEAMEKTKELITNSLT